jgi:hypothetical protein
VLVPQERFQWEILGHHVSSVAVRVDMPEFDYPEFNLLLDEVDGQDQVVGALGVTGVVGNPVKNH